LHVRHCVNSIIYTLSGGLSGSTGIGTTSTHTTYTGVIPSSGAFATTHITYTGVISSSRAFATLFKILNLAALTVLVG
jgi:hypothetical protein